MIINKLKSAGISIKRISAYSLFISFLHLAFCHSCFAHNDMTFWFDKPAQDWETEGLPIGNGALGAVIHGGIESDSLQFNEKTLWEGGPGSKHGYDFGHPKNPNAYLQKLASIQKEIEEKGELSPKHVAEQLGREIKGYGNYQSFGNLVMQFDKHKNKTVENYQRALDISTGIGTVSYRIDGVQYTREYIVSYPDQIIAINLRASEPGEISLNLSLNPSSGRSKKYTLSDDSITVNGTQQENGLKYEAQLRVKTTNGKTQKNENSLNIRNADSVFIILSAGTNYAQKYPHYSGAHPHKRLTQIIKSAARKNPRKIMSDHIADHQSLFGKMTLNLGGTMPNKPITSLLKEYKGKGKQDIALETLYFQFGRYLLIASSRPGSLPANLQGVWNHSNTPPWNADYHININLQMNYWPANVTNIAETNAPLFDFIDSLITPGSISAQKILGVKKGWTLFLNTNIYGFTGLIKWPTAFWQPEAGAWLAQHYYDHYLFTRDKNFLKTRAYPAIKGAAELWIETLVEDKRDGSLVVNPSYSPEHGGFTAGAAMSQQIVFDVLRNAYEAATLLNDKKFAKKAKQTLDQIDTGTRIGRWGQLQEWKTDQDNQASKHRHISHLYALHPGRQISPLTSPTFAEAAKTTLNSRGDAGTGWSKAWKVNLWARLLDGDRAYKLLKEQLIHSTLPNMWDNHPPFQIDGNFGATAGIAEMLIQSHNDEIHLLPALPTVWQTGNAKGLKARGNVEVDIDWKQGRFNYAEIKPAFSGSVRVRLNHLSGTPVLTELGTGKKVSFQREKNVVVFSAKSNKTYKLSKL